MSTEPYLRGVFTRLSASNHALEEREKHDYYATEPLAVEKLLEKESFNNKILEPCCGEGHISEVLIANGYDVASEDLFDRNYGQVRDFFHRDSWDGDIITNPPYRNALDFVKHSLNIVEDGSRVAMLLKIQFLEGQERYKFYQDNPPEKVYVFSKRTLCAKNGDFEKYPSSAVCYAWYIWEKGFRGEPIIRWII